jgi:cytosine/adenosine deaminase-related metal-dependent hydrolase
MRVKREFRDREDVEVAVLDALVERGEEGMTVFELRAAVDVDIDAIEAALASLKEDSLISVDTVDSSDRVVIVPDERVVPDPEDLEEELGFFDSLRERFGF